MEREKDEMSRKEQKVGLEDIILDVWEEGSKAVPNERAFEFMRDNMPNCEHDIYSEEGRPLGYYFLFSFLTEIGQLFAMKIVVNNECYVIQPVLPSVEDLVSKFGRHELHLNGNGTVDGGMNGKFDSLREAYSRAIIWANACSIRSGKMKNDEDNETQSLDGELDPHGIYYDSEGKLFPGHNKKGAIGKLTLVKRCYF